MTDTPHPIDLAVGMRIRMRREDRGLTQQDLARAIGVTFQQVQKYERGTNRVSASRLLQIAARLETTGSALLGEDGSEMTDDQGSLLSAPGAIDLLRAYSVISSSEHRRGLLAMARSLDPAKAR